jgi:dTMP kinase
MAGLFVTFEGGEGSGKSTQIRILAERLRALGRDVVLTREPGGTPEGEKLRALLVSGEHRWAPISEALLNNAARQVHLAEVIRPALAQDKIVLCDRFMDSTRVYQSFAGGVSVHLIDALEREVVGSCRPDVTFIFDLDPEQGLARASARNDAVAEDRFERKGLAFHQSIRRGFLEIAKTESARCRLIDAGQGVDDVSHAIWREVEEWLQHG